MVTQRTRARLLRRQCWRTGWRPFGFTCVLVAIAPSALARTWVVDQQGSGDFTVIQDAAIASADGDTILLYPGRYDEYRPYDYGALTESTCVAIERDNITLRGIDRDAVIIGPESYRWTDPREPNGIGTSALAQGTRIENLTIENLVSGIVNFEEGIVQDVSIRGCREAIGMFPSGAVVFERLLIEGSRRYGMSTWNQPVETIFRDCTFRGPKTDVLISNDASARLLDCVFEEGAWLQFQTASTGLVEACNVSGGGAIVVVGSSRIRLARCKLGVAATTALQIINASSVTGSICQFQGGQHATILVHGNSEARLDSCEILNLAGPTVEVNYTSASSNTVDLRNNWWGTTDPAQIEEWILDGRDDPDRGAVVLFEPFLTHGVPLQRTSFSALKSRFVRPE